MLIMRNFNEHVHANVQGDDLDKVTVYMWKLKFMAIV